MLTYSRHRCRMSIEFYLSCKKQGKFLEKLDIENLKPKNKKKKAKFRLDINEQIEYQPFLGFGYSFEHTSCYNIMQFPPEKRRKVLEMLVDPKQGAGMNLWRLCIGTPDFTYEFYSYDDIPIGEEDMKLEQFSIEKDREYVLPVVNEALEINPDLTFFSSPWSPPGWMKGPESKYFKGKKKKIEGSKGLCGGRLLPKYYDVYADYFIRY